MVFSSGASSSQTLIRSRIAQVLAEEGTVSIVSIHLVLGFFLRLRPRPSSASALVDYTLLVESEVGTI